MFCTYIGATISLTSGTQQVIDEGNAGLSGDIKCVSLTNANSGLERDVVVLLNTIEGTAGEQCKVEV